MEPKATRNPTVSGNADTVRCTKSIHRSRSAQGKLGKETALAVQAKTLNQTIDSSISTGGSISSAMAGWAAKFWTARKLKASMACAAWRQTARASQG